MREYELHVSHSTVFSGYQKLFKHANYVVVGVPFDLTSTYRTGARFAPNAIREASLNIETYSFRSKIDMEDLKIHDLGDLHISSSSKVTMQRLKSVVGDLLKAGKTPVLIGGEHTITLGAMQGVRGKDIALISFDAHLDLRKKYMELTTSHTTFMRRIHELVKPAKIIELGTRAVCRDELAYAKKSGIQYFTMEQIRKSKNETIRAAKKALESCKETYLTIDMDVLDPAFAPAVQNPEPEGLSFQVLYEIISHLCDDRMLGLDLVEVTPFYDSGSTAILAAKILYETLCHLEKERKS